MALHPVLTERRKDWLESLSKTPGQKRHGRGRTACDCMRLGWTKWADDHGEVLTDEGHAMLVPQAK